MVGPNDDGVYEEYIVVENIIPHSEMNIPVTSFSINNIDYTGNNVGINYGQTTYKNYDMNIDDGGNVSVVINLYSKAEDTDIKFTIIDGTAQNSFMPLILGDDAKKHLFSFTYTGESLNMSVEYINSNWELIGSTAVDLTNYATKEDLSNKMDKFAEASINNEDGFTTLTTPNVLAITSSQRIDLNAAAIFLGSDNVSMTGRTLKSVGYPIEFDDAANKQYVDNLFQNIEISGAGFSIWKSETLYKVGDIVMADLHSLDGENMYTYTALITCKMEHTSNRDSNHPVNILESDFDNLWDITYVIKTDTSNKMDNFGEVEYDEDFNTITFPKGTVITTNDYLNIHGGLVTISANSDIYFSGNKLKNVGNPDTADDAATKGYVDDIVGNIQSILSTIVDGVE